MSRLWAAWAATIGLGLLAAPALAQPIAPGASAQVADAPPVPGTTQVDWVAKPSGDDVSDAYPPLAQTFGVTGHVLLHCKVATTGRTEDCQVQSETPKGFGFGAAALKVAPLFRMAPATAGGSATVSDVRIPIRFALPKGDARDGLAMNILQGVAAALLTLALIPVVAAVNDRLRRRGARTARTGDVLANGFGLVGPALRRAPLPLLAYGVVIAAFQILGPTPGTNPDIAGLGRMFMLLPLILLGGLVAYGASFRVALGRLHPTDPVFRIRWLGLQIGQVEGRLFVAMLVFAVLIIVGEAAMLALGLLAFFALRLLVGAEAPVFVLALAPCLVLMIGLLAFCRLSTFITAWIAEGGERLGASWRATRACLLPPILASLVLALISGLGLIVARSAGLFAVSGPEASTVKLLAGAVYGVVMVLLVPVRVGVWTALYQALQAPVSTTTEA